MHSPLAVGAGNDTLVGGGGKNVLIGGNGADTLTGGTSEDLMIGARFTSETNAAALTALLTEWASANSYANRVAHLSGTLSGGLNGSTLLTSTTFKEDASVDALTGGTGKDWYLRNSLGATVINRDTTTNTDLIGLDTTLAPVLR